MNYPDSLNSLIESFKKLPGIGEKTAERLSFAVMNMEKEDVKVFSNSMSDVLEKKKKCSGCGHITEDDICEVWKDHTRSPKTICVVKDSKDIISIEKTGSYTGKYHVLNVLISLIDGRGPEDININKLVDRIKTEKTEEVILAISSTLEGETTALYISKLLEKTGVSVSKIARGIPMGTDMEYLDSMTLSTALTNRDRIS